MNATRFLDDYSESLSHSTLAGPLAMRGQLRQRVRDFRQLRDELKSRGVSDDDIAGKLKEIMGIILEHLGDIAAILALVLPLFLTPAPVAGVAPVPGVPVESDE